jgi:hypothetical protein
MDSVSARARKYSWPDERRDRSSGLQHAQNRCGAANEVESAVVGGDLMIGLGVGTEEITQLVVSATEFASRSWAIEPARRTVAAFDAAMILLQSIVEVLAVALAPCVQDASSVQPRHVRCAPAPSPSRSVCPRPVARQRGNHQMESVRCACAGAMCPGIGEWIDNLQLLDNRARPCNTVPQAACPVFGGHLSRPGGSRANFRVLLHHEGQRAGAWTLDLPLHHR